MKIAILASEGAPYVKSGGLGDVMEALPAALSRIPGNEVVLILPYYKKIRDNEAFQVEKGPVFANFVLADEINRAPAKVQSALLEAMQERQVTIGKETFQLPKPFLVLATQNPIEQEGTYPLPEASYRF